MASDRTFLGMFKKLGRDILLNRIASSNLLNSPMRLAILRRVGMQIDPSVNLEAGCWFSGRQVTIGEGTRINVQGFFDCGALISIGQHVNFGPQVMIHTSWHEIGGEDRRCGTQTVQPVHIGDACWLGLRSTILPGVTVGDGCVIAAGAVVIHDCEPNGLYAGVPAKRIRELDADGQSRPTHTPKRRKTDVRRPITGDLNVLATEDRQPV